MFEEVLADRLRVLGSNHPDTLNSRNSLAYALQGAGRLDDAIALFEEVLADSTCVLGPNHPDTVLYRKNLEHAREERQRQ